MSKRIIFTLSNKQHEELFSQLKGETNINKFVLEAITEKLKRDKPKSKKKEIVDPNTHADTIVTLLDKAKKRK